MGAIYRAGEAGTRTLSVIAGTGDVALPSWAATGKLKIETSAAASAREHSTFFVIYPPPNFPKGVVHGLTVRESERVSNPPANPCRTTNQGTVPQLRPVSSGIDCQGRVAINPNIYILYLPGGRCTGENPCETGSPQRKMSARWLL